MAEFQEVMKHYRRMCHKYHGITSCGACPLSVHNNGLNKTCVDVFSSLHNEAERIIMKWAAEHPEPKYPTWLEYLQSISVIQKSYPLAEVESCVFKAVQHAEIPAYIAKKLGIEPIEGGCEG